MPSESKHPCPICSREIFKGAEVLHLSKPECIDLRTLAAINRWMRNDECDRLLLVKPHVGTVFQSDPVGSQTVCMTCGQPAHSCTCPGF